MLSGFFFSNQKTAYEMRISDWSSDVCSSDLKFTDVTVDPTTGSQIIRAQFPNPRGLLLPGMYVRAELVDGTKSNGLLVPQVAVSRDEKGNPTVLIVGPENKVEMRMRSEERRGGKEWVGPCRSRWEQSN